MTSTTTRPPDLMRNVDALAQQASSADGLMTAIAQLLHEKLLKYNWVGFYMLEKDAVPPMLVLGPFQGTNPADHGILCAMGSVAATPRTLHHSAVSPRRGYTDIKARDETAMRWLMNAYP